MQDKMKIFLHEILLEIFKHKFEKYQFRNIFMGAIRGAVQIFVGAYAPTSPLAMPPLGHTARVFVVRYLHLRMQVCYLRRNMI